MANSNPTSDTIHMTFERQKRTEREEYFESLAELNIEQGMPIPFSTINGFLETHYTHKGDPIADAMVHIAAHVDASISMESEYKEEIGGSLYDMLAKEPGFIEAYSEWISTLRSANFNAHAVKYVQQHGGKQDQIASTFRGVSTWLVSWVIIHFNRHLKLIPTVEYGKLMEKYYLAINTGERDIKAQPFLT